MKKILLALLIFSVAVFLLLKSNFNDVQINKYDNLQQVKKDKAIERGWIPANLPESAYNITETHDIDKNQLFGSFYYKKNDDETLMKELVLHKDLNNTYMWKGYLFKIDRKTKHVKYRNNPDHNLSQK